MCWPDGFGRATQRWAVEGRELVGLLLLSIVGDAVRFRRPCERVAGKIVEQYDDVRTMIHE